MFLLVPAHPSCPGQNPKSRETVVCVCVLFNWLLLHELLHLICGVMPG